METWKTIGVALLSGLGGYIGGVPLSWFMVDTFSSNRHDKSLEAGMSSIFFFGPILAVVAAVVGGILYGSRQAS